MIETVAAPPSGPSAFVGTFVEPAVRERLRRIAVRNDRSQSAEIRLALKRHFDVEDAPLNREAQR